MPLFNRSHPRFCLMAGLILCGFKWWFNWFAGQDVNRKAQMQATEFGLLDPALADAWDRIEGRAPDGDGKIGRLSHNLTNLAIEWNRRWGAYGTKFIASFGAWFALAVVVLMVLL